MLDALAATFLPLSERQLRMPKSRHQLPSLPYMEWRPTKDTLHLYLQVVGKVKLAHTPRINHWWHVAYTPYTWGLRTGPMPHGLGSFEFAFDLVDHELEFMTSEGSQETLLLRDGLSVAELHAWVLRILEQNGISSAGIRWIPYDCMSDIPFAVDRTHAHYDAEAVRNFHRILSFVTGVFDRFRGRFVGKSTPVYFYWRTFDLALARFSGARAAAQPAGGSMLDEAYSHEFISFGFWPGDEHIHEPAFYSYVHPEPSDLARRALKPADAYWLDRGENHIAFLGYDAVRNSGDPAASLIDFLEASYVAASTAAGWSAELNAAQ